MPLGKQGPVQGLVLRHSRQRAARGPKRLLEERLQRVRVDHTQAALQQPKGLLDALATIGTAEVKKTAKFVIPGLVMLKTRKKPATKAGKREMFGKVVLVKAKPAKTVVKAFAAKAIKDEF